MSCVIYEKRLLWKPRNKTHSNSNVWVNFEVNLAPINISNMQHHVQVRINMIKVQRILYFKWMTDIIYCSLNPQIYHFLSLPIKFVFLLIQYIEISQSSSQYINTFDIITHDYSDHLNKSIWYLLLSWRKHYCYEDVNTVAIHLKWYCMRPI